MGKNAVFLTVRRLDVSKVRKDTVFRVSKSIGKQLFRSYSKKISSKHVSKKTIMNYLKDEYSCVPEVARKGRDISVSLS